MGADIMHVVSAKARSDVWEDYSALLLKKTKQDNKTVGIKW